MPKISHALTTKEKRHLRISAKIRGTAAKPRVVIFRSNKHTVLQAIDDQTQKTVAAAADYNLVGAKAAKAAKKPLTKTERAIETATALAKKLQESKIESVVYDRAGYRYHGRVRAVADALRKVGIKL